MNLSRSGQELSTEHALLIALVLWGGAMAAMIATLPLLPVDETRYLTVAWEMREGGTWLLPTLNGEPYSHKPPLLFWLVNIAWTLFGTSVPAARIVPIAASAGVLVLTYRLGRALLGPERHAPALAVLLVLASPATFVYGPLLMFDQLLAVWVLFGLLQLWHAGQDPARWCPWVLLGLALGLGLLTKGPVVLLHLGIPALLVRFWAPNREGVVLGRWIAGFAVSLAIGAGIILAWAIPAAIAGGPEFAEMIFWKQSAGRMVESFDHRQPVWFYIPVLAVFLLPLLFWPPLWRAASAWRREDFSPEARFLLCWIVSALAAFTTISGKQPHYLLPLLPGLAILFAGLLKRAEPARADALILALPLAALFAVLTIGPLVVHWTGHDTPTGIISKGIGEFNPGISLAAAAGALLLVLLGRGRLTGEAMAIAGSVALLIVTITMQCRDSVYRFYDLQPVADAVQPYKGGPMAFVNKYLGEIGFLARLERPLEVVRTKDLKNWFNQHANGTAIVRARTPIQSPEFAVVHTQVFRTGWHFSVIRLKQAAGPARNSPRDPTTGRKG